MKKYNLTFEIVKTEAEAKAFCNKENADGTRYKRKVLTASYTPWSSQNQAGKGFICWYYY